MNNKKTRYLVTYDVFKGGGHETMIFQLSPQSFFKIVETSYVETINTWYFPGAWHLLDQKRVLVSVATLQSFSNDSLEGLFGNKL